MSRSSVLTKCIMGGIALALMIGVSSAALADWDPGDPHKMHYPQLPDPDGWDAAFFIVHLASFVLADDWQCTETGPIDGIHFWISFRDDDVQSPGDLSLWIYGSTPGGPLWEDGFPSAEYTLREYGLGNQGWFDPLTYEVLPNNHTQIWQINITGLADLPDPFIQEEGEIYWLAIGFDQMALTGGTGWKISQNAFGSTAVWIPYYGTHPSSWFALPSPWPGGPDPAYPGPVDLAFVVTGTPPPDSDSDGYTSDVDCDDSDSTVNPGAPEVCGDGIDNNCDGSADEACVEALAMDLMSFEGSASETEVVLHWVTGTELDRLGFNIHRSDREEDDFSRINTSVIYATGDATIGGSYVYTDEDAVPGVTHYYRLESIAIDGSSTLHDPVAVTIPGTIAYALAAYPNPFNPETVVRYDLPEAGSVSLMLYNLMGQTVRVLVSGHQGTGSHRVVWDGRDSEGQAVVSGVYLCRMVVGEYSVVRKLLLVR